MTAFPTVRVAAIHATPVVLDGERRGEKVARLLHDVGHDGRKDPLVCDLSDLREPAG